MDSNIAYFRDKYGIEVNSLSKNITNLGSEPKLSTEQLIVIQHLLSGVVGNFLLWERSHGIMVTYPIVIRRGGGVVPE